MRFPFSRATRVERDAESNADRAADPDRTATANRTSDTDRIADAESGAGPGLGVRLAEGAKAGLVATLTMTVYRLPVSRSLPPTARFWTKFVSGGNPDDHPVPAVALHLLYGVAGGVVFGLLAPIDAGDASDEELRRRSSDADTRTTAPTDDSRTDDSRTDTRTEDAHETARLETVGLFTGVVYALALSAFGERVVLEGLLDMDLELDERLVFHAGHLVYGLSLGTWFGSRTGDRR